MKSTLKTCITAAAIGIGAAASSQANLVTYQPNEAASTDVFVYEFPPAAGIDLNDPNNGFGNMLPAIKTGNGHEIRSLIYFNLATAGITSIEPGETALLQLYVNDITVSGFGVNPTPENPAVIDLFANDPASTAFTEATKWTTKPLTIAPAVDTQSITGINGWVSFDVTAQIQAWLADPASNEGFTLIQQAVVTAPSGKVGVVFDSSNMGSTAPILTVVPEPMALGVLALGALFARRRMG